MLYKTYYKSPVGNILLVSDENNLKGAWIEGQKYYLGKIKEEDTRSRVNIEILKETKNWLDRYFKKEKPRISELSIEPEGNEFRQNVWKLLCEIPYGKTTTYGEIAKKVAKMMNKKSMSAQAVGGAVGHNPISIIIPCHRVIGKDGSLTGYAGGIDTKIKLLNIEGIKINRGC